ncbi:MAG: sigma-70 family RNA polymerase sigma factor [bacterium]|nr:sigma-70 family RNA polymerase sigma factor [bacterium]
MSLNDSSLIALVQKAKGGDSAAFDDLYRQFMTPIFRFVFIRVRNRADAEDLTQTVFVKAWNALPRFDDREERFLAWLYTIARNSIIDHWKKKKDLIPDDPDVFFATREAPDRTERLAEQNEASRLVYGALTSLGDDQREIMTLKFIDGLTNKEIAKMTGKSEPAIRQVQSRALKSLRAEFKNNNLI